MAGDTLVKPSLSANGLFGWMGKHGRHILYGAPVQPSGGDYAAGDQDQVGGPFSGGGAAQAYPMAAMLVTPAGVPYTASGGGGGGGATAPYAATPLGYQQILAATLAAPDALTVPTGATFAIIEPEGGAVRYRDDGTNPTGAIGMPLGAGQSLQASGAAMLAALKFIEATGSAAILNISYYK